MSPLALRVFPEAFAVVRLDTDAALPGWATDGKWWSVTRTAEELSIVCAASALPDGPDRVEGGWRLLGVEGVLDFSLIGILAELAGVLAEAEVSVFVVSTFDTDYLLVPGERLDHAVAALRAAGHRVTA